MKLLIITQVVDSTDPSLGFFHAWILEFAKTYEKVTVICLKKGTFDLPKNVQVLSLGKEDSISKFHYLRRFYKYIWQYRKEYDTVFVHMNPVYVILGWKVWFLLGKKISLWYTHKSVDLKLRLATFLVNIIFTASTESFRIKSKKVKIVGHGIDMTLFSPALEPLSYQSTESFKILVVGRLSSIKRNDRIIDAIIEVTKKGIRVGLVFVGEAITANDIKCKKFLEEKASFVNPPNAITFAGGKAHDAIPRYLQNSHLFVTMSDTGSLDKALLEALAMGVPVLVTNPAGVEVLVQSGYTEGIFRDTDSLALKIENIITEYKTYSTHALAILPPFIKKNHGLQSLIATITHLLT
ncbi:glycosyltransferase family 4 protein [Candidatus Nomurabacteria bacterium]|jgi:glycosyltransferase involved in cell wall biosynthesis|nr:MAG: glycosyltransferase family 4 protein [Candidatus Nomurabacteria bacterium]